MASMNELTELPPDFDGHVRLFPLPNLVMFPKVVQPLHIFEPRYCDMLEDAMASDQIIALGMLQEGWEKDYEGRPSVEPVICVGRVISHTRAPDNRHNLLLLGLRRARIIYELPVSHAFRKVRVEILQDEVDGNQGQERVRLHDQLADLFRRYLPKNEQVREQFEQLLAMPVELGMLADVVAFTVSLSPLIKQQLLAELRVDHRAALLIKHLTLLLNDVDEGILPNGTEFPPKFSDN